MRAFARLAAIAAVCALSAKATAQSPIVFGNQLNQPIQFVTIDTGNSAVPIAQPQNTGFSISRLANFFHKATPISTRRTIGRSNFPTKGQLPGNDYLNIFRYRGNN